ncbi:uncharacterized protein [Panulirus ornatus]|uniref:uncharacterized protein n=1 Tax=Panulirus ornatus TaxID=150431 RepID=UPI003A8C0E69
MAYKATLVAAVIGLALGAPQYGYQTPPEPSSLYETPAETVQEPVQLYETPAETVQEPVQLYETPIDNDLVGQPQEPVPAIVEPPQMEGMPYAFQFGVEDQDSGNAYSHVENSDGRTTQGEYRVLLPDGRTQVVKFFDDGNGFNAEVSYEK